MKRTPTALAAAALLATGAWARAAAPDTEAVEFYNQDTGHYFVTASASEALGIDAGAAGPGWLRTGRSFQAWLAKSAAPADAQAVCRFYSPGANSHFYTASAGECLQLQALEAAERNATGTVKGWGYEGTAFYIQVPSGGACPAGTAAITRVYNDGYANGEGANHRFVDDAALQDLMVDRQWIAEGTAFCAAKKSTGGEANLAATASSFDAIAGAWSASARWKTETAAGETSATHDLTLTFAADGTLTGSGNGCSFTGAVTIGDGFRSFFRGTASATGCADSAFDGDYPKLRLERFGAGTLMARLQRGDDANEVSIEARLANGSTPAPPAPAPGFDSVAGDWSGTVAWVATQHLSTGNFVERVSANKPLTLAIGATGTVTGSGFGCTVSGTLGAAQSGGEHGGFGGDITLAGCEQPLFDGEFAQVHVARAGASRIVVSLEQETRDAQGSTNVEIEGLLQSGASTTPPPPPPAADALVTGAWQGSVRFLAVAKGAKDDQGATLVSSMETLSFSIGDDGAFSGTGFGCTFAGTVTLAFGGRAATGGSVAASGCTKDVFDGTYTHVRFERDDEGRLEVQLERETSDSSGKIEVRIGGTVARAAP